MKTSNKKQIKSIVVKDKTTPVVKAVVIPMNCTQLNNSLMDVFSRVNSNTIDKQVAVTMARIADTTIRNLKLQVIYNKQMNKKNKITFLES